MTYKNFDPKLLELFESLNIRFEYFQHPAVKTMQEMEDFSQSIDAVIAKNILLKHKSGMFVFVSLIGSKRLDTKMIAQYLQVPKKFSFASSQDLYDFLKINPGSASIYSLINAPAELKVILDKDLMDSKSLGFHPNNNQATIVLDTLNFQKYWNSITQEKFIIKI